MNDVSDIGNRKQGDLRTIKGTPSGCGTWAGFGAARLAFVIVVAGGFIQQGGNVSVIHNLDGLSFFNMNSNRHAIA